MLQALYARYQQLDIKCNLAEEEAVEAVKQEGHALRYVHEQTESICVEAVKQNGHALQYVHEQTESICVEAVKQNGHALRYVADSMFGVRVEVNGKAVVISHASAVAIGLH